MFEAMTVENRMKSCETCVDTVKSSTFLLMLVCGEQQIKKFRIINGFKCIFRPVRLIQTFSLVTSLFPDTLASAHTLSIKNTVKHSCNICTVNLLVCVK